MEETPEDVEKKKKIPSRSAQFRPTQRRDGGKNSCRSCRFPRLFGFCVCGLWWAFLMLCHPRDVSVVCSIVGKRAVHKRNYRRT